LIFDQEVSYIVCDSSWSVPYSSFSSTEIRTAGVLLPLPSPLFEYPCNHRA